MNVASSQQAGLACVLQSREQLPHESCSIRQKQVLGRGILQYLVAAL